MINKLKSPILFITLASALVGLVTGIVLVIESGVDLSFGVSNFFSFFTIQSNILVAIFVTILFFSGEKKGAWFKIFGLIALINITVTGIIYTLFLQSVWNPEGLAYVSNFLLHFSTPVLFVLLWILFVEKSFQPIRYSVFLIIHPSVYLIYTLVRGGIVNWYPYPFIDAGVLSQQNLLVNILAMIIFFSALGVVIIFLNNKLSKN